MTENITMIELFSGIGAQEKALRQLGVPYKIIATCDCDKDAVLSYAAMRIDFENEFNSYNFPSTEDMIAELQNKNVGYDFMKGKHTVTTRTPIDKLKQYYLADKLSRNLGDIGKVERLPYADIVTYSFPCTDLSVAGKGEGMQNKCDTCGHSWPIDFSNSEETLICPNCGNKVSSSTRSGLLGQVQRLLAVAYKNNELPKYLLLENVKNLVGKKFVNQFNAWVKWLDSIGYNTYYEVLNAKHYGIPQNRERIFAISIRKDVDNGTFKFPERVPLTTRLKDILENNVDEKYYLPDDRIETILNPTFIQEKKRIQMKDVCDTLLARDWKDPKCVQVEDSIKIIGNYMPSNHDASRVVDIDGIAPTVKENHGTVTAIAEPFIVASRGRNPDNPSDRTTGSPTEQRLEPNFSGCTNTITSVQKDNYVAEPQVLRAERTEYGKAIRKQYEAGEVYEKIGNMRELSPRTDGVSNTITTLLKDNYVYEPQVNNVGNIYPSNGQNGNIYDVNGISPTINVGTGVKGCGIGSNNTPKVIIPEPIVYDDYNGRISSDQDAINTLTTNCGASAERNGVKILEPMIVDDLYANREPRLYTDASPALRSERSGLKVAEHFVKYRIRKLTPKECWRLMGFTDEDHDRASQYVSASARYKQAGNSICTCCLVSIFNALFLEDYSTSYKDKLVDYNF